MSKWGARLKKVEQLAQSFHQKPLASPYKPRLLPCQPSSVWRFFPRQNLAFSFAQSCKEVQRAAETTSAVTVEDFLHWKLYIKTSWCYFSLFTGCACFRSRERTVTTRSKDLPGHQLHRAVALLQVNTLHPKSRPVSFAPLDFYTATFFFNSPSGHFQSRWCTAMRWYQRAACASSTLTWSSTNPPTERLMARPWCRLSSRWRHTFSFKSTETLIELFIYKDGRWSFSLLKCDSIQIRWVTMRYLRYLDLWSIHRIVAINIAIHQFPLPTAKR